MVCHIGPDFIASSSVIPETEKTEAVKAPVYCVTPKSALFLELPKKTCSKSLFTFCPPFYLPHLQKKSPLNFSQLICEYPIYPVDDMPLGEEAIKEVFGNRPIKGKLFCQSNGYHYLKLPMVQLRKFAKSIPKEAIEEILKSQLGLHISIILPEENDGRVVSEIGDAYYISFGKARKIRNEQGTLWVIEIESLSLLNLRRKYNLPDKVQGHPFYLTLGIQQRKVILPPHEPGYRVNPGMQEA
jgi:hypothetical protein